MTTDLPAKYQVVKVAAYPPEGAGRRRYGSDQGRATYSVSCAYCHGMKGQGGETAPALTDIGSRKTVGELAQWIRDPAPPMPKLSPPLTDSDSEAVARYIAQFK